MAKTSLRIGTSSLGGDERWHPELTHVERKVLEAAYGVTFVEDSWEELLKHLHFYAVFAGFERNAAPVADLQRLLNNLQKASGEFLNAINAANTEDLGYAMNRIVDEKWEEIFTHQWRRNQYWDAMVEEVTAELTDLGHPDPDGRAWEIVGGWRGRRFFPDPNITDDLREGVYELQHSVSRTMKSYEAGNEATVKDGDAWRDFIQGLSRWAESYRFPRKVSKDVDDVSSFIRFISALQGLMPQNYRRHTQSLPALATGVSRALAKAKAGNGSNKPADDTGK